MRSRGEEPTSPVLLLVEDNLADIVITRRAMQQAGFDVELLVLRDGKDALDYLIRREVGPLAGSLREWRLPDLILLDINMPRMNGHEVLRELRSDPRLELVPILVLSTSNNPEDVRRAYQAGARTYFTKPSTFEGFVELLRRVQAYWLEMALLPGV